MRHIVRRPQGCDIGFFFLRQQHAEALRARSLAEAGIQADEMVPPRAAVRPKEGSGQLKGIGRPQRMKPEEADNLVSNLWHWGNL